MNLTKQITKTQAKILTYFHIFLTLILICLSVILVNKNTELNEDVNMLLVINESMTIIDIMDKTFHKFNVTNKMNVIFYSNDKKIMMEKSCKDFKKDTKIGQACVKKALEIIKNKKSNEILT